MAQDTVPKPPPPPEGNDVGAASGCPSCGQRDADELLIDTEDPDKVTCQTCSTVYRMPALLEPPPSEAAPADGREGGDGRHVSITVSVVKYCRREDGRMPVALAMLCHRRDPKLSDVTNYRGTSRLAWALNQDEALGIGARKGRELWPLSEGWSGVDVAAYWLSGDTCEAIAAMVYEDHAASDQLGGSAGRHRSFLGLSWEVVPWGAAGAELPAGVADLLEKCGRTLFRRKEPPRTYLVADYDPDVARLLAQGALELKRAALRGVQNLMEEVASAEWQLEEALKAAAPGEASRVR